MNAFMQNLHIFRNIVNLFYTLSSHSVSVNVGKDVNPTVRPQSNITSSELWIIFPVTFLFLLVLHKQKSKKKSKNISFLICMTFL